MFTRNKELKERIINIITNEKNNVIAHATDIGIRIEFTMLANLLYNRFYIQNYNISSKENNFCEITAKTSYRRSLDSEIISETNEPIIFEIQSTIDNFKENIVSITDDILVIPTDIGLISIYTAVTNVKAYPSTGNISFIVYTWSIDYAKELAEYIKKNVVKRKKENNKKDTYNIAIKSSYGITLKKMNFRDVECDIKTNYNDDIPYDTICRLLNSDKQELIMFYGPPGTGKTTLIKHLINKFIDKNIIVMDTNSITTISDDTFIKFLSNNPNSIMILEDCDKVLRAREDGNVFMSTILNLTDGLIGESFNIKFICTFNTSEKKLDPALLRRGRLSLMYKFNPLTLDKVKNFIPDADKEMPIGDIYNREENIISNKTIKIGF